MKFFIVLLWNVDEKSDWNQAIILAYQRSDYYLNIVNSAKGIIFFGVPHRGADLAHWAKFATNILSYASLGAVGNSRFVKALERNSPEFAAISRAFIQPASRFQHIRSFYESVKIGNQIVSNPKRGFYISYNTNVYRLLTKTLRLSSSTMNCQYRFKVLTTEISASSPAPKVRNTSLFKMHCSI